MVNFSKKGTPDSSDKELQGKQFLLEGQPVTFEEAYQR